MLKFICIFTNLSMVLLVLLMFYHLQELNSKVQELEYITSSYMMKNDKRSIAHIRATRSITKTLKYIFNNSSFQSILVEGLTTDEINEFFIKNNDIKDER